MTIDEVIDKAEAPEMKIPVQGNVLLHIEVNQEDIDNAILKAEGRVVDMVEALFAAAKMNINIAKCVMAAAAMLASDNAGYATLYGELLVYFTDIKVKDDE